MADHPPFNAEIPPSSEEIDHPIVEGSQTASEHDEIPCEDRDIQGHTQWNCNKCRERLDRDFDDLVREDWTAGDWTESQIAAVGLFRQFDKTPWSELMPDPSQPKKGPDPYLGLELPEGVAGSHGCCEGVSRGHDCTTPLAESSQGQHHHIVRGRCRVQGQ